MTEIRKAQPKYLKVDRIDPIIDVYVPKSYDKAALKRLKTALAVRRREFIKF